MHGRAAIKARMRLFFLNQAVSLARQMDEPMVYEALYSDTRIDDQGVIQWGNYFVLRKHISGFSVGNLD